MSSPYEFFCASEGYFDKMEAEAMLHRANAFIIYRALGGKDSIDRVWPIGKKKTRDRVIMTPEMKAQILKAHNIE